MFSSSRKRIFHSGTPAVTLLVLGVFSQEFSKLQAQSRIDLRTQSRNVDFSEATSTKPIKTGSAQPSTCTLGEVFFNLNSPSGQNLYGCTASNTWTQLSGVAGSTTSAINDCLVVGSGSTITVTAPCRISIGGVIHSINTNAAATLSGTVTAGTIFLYWDSAGNLVADENTQAVLTCGANCRTAANGGFPPGAFPLATAVFSNNAFTGSSVTDLRSFFSNKTVYCGAGLTCTENQLTGELTVAANTANSLLTKSTFQAGQPVRCASSAASSAHTCSLAPILSPGYSTGMVIEFTPTATAVSGAATLAIDGFAAKAIKKADGLTDPGPDEIAIGQQVALRYDGSAFRMPAGNKRKSLSCMKGDPAGPALSAGVLCLIVSPTACTISSWDMLVDAGTATVQTWKIATGTAIPTASNTISVSGVPITSGTAIHSTALNDFTTTSIAANDILAFKLAAVSTAKYIYFGVQCDQ